MRRAIILARKPYKDGKVLNQVTISSFSIDYYGHFSSSFHKKQRGGWGHIIVSFCTTSHTRCSPRVYRHFRSVGRRGRRSTFVRSHHRVLSSLRIAGFQFLSSANVLEE